MIQRACRYLCCAEHLVECGTHEGDVRDSQIEECAGCETDYCEVHLKGHDCLWQQTLQAVPVPASPPAEYVLEPAALVASAMPIVLPMQDVGDRFVYVGNGPAIPAGRWTCS